MGVERAPWERGLYSYHQVQHSAWHIIGPQNMMVESNWSEGQRKWECLEGLIFKSSPMDILWKCGNGIEFDMILENLH